MRFLVINIKKYFFSFIFIIFLLFLILFSTTNLEATKSGLALWYNSVLPTLFPFFIAIELIFHTNIPYTLGKVFNNLNSKLFNVSGEASSAIILGLIGGTPIGAKTVCNLKKQQAISKIEAERLISFVNNTSPLFIIGTVSISLLGSKIAGYILLFSNILSAFLVGICFRFWKKNNLDLNYKEIKFNSKNKPIKTSEFGEILNNSIKNSIASILQIGGFIVLFSIIISMLNNIFISNSALFNSFFYGIIEMTNGINYSLILENNLPVISFLLGFSGLSILFQVYSIISKENISIKPYLYGKILQGIFSAIITYLLISFA